MNKGIKFITVIFLVILLIPLNVRASTDINLNCTAEVMVGNNFSCDIEMKNDQKIFGVISSYKYDKVFSYNKTIIGNNWEAISGSSNGFTLVNVEGVEQDDKLVTVQFLVSNDAVPGNTYSINLNNIQVSDGNNDITINDKENKIKVLSINEVVDNINVNGEALEVKDGVTNYTVVVPYEVTDVDILATLKSDKYQFTKDKSPGKVSNLKVGDNVFELEIVSGDHSLVNYEININRLTEKKSNNISNKVEEKVTNPSTGGIGKISIIIIGCVLIGSLGIIIYFVQKGKKVK